MSDNDIDDILNGAVPSGEDFSEDWSAALEEQRQVAQRMAEEQVKADDAQHFSKLVDKPAPQGGEERREDINLDVILDIPVTISMEIGRTKINIRNLLQLTQGSVVELDRLAGEPMDVLVNGTLIAHGEVVVVNDKFGIRLTDVLSPAERVRKLR